MSPALVDESNLGAAVRSFRVAAPFDHCVVDDFFPEETALALAGEFPDPTATCWHEYKNALEVKRTCNNWNAFGASTYAALAMLNSPVFMSMLGELLGLDDLSSDPGLNGGGWHSHEAGGKLNPHLDYNLHPRLGLQRKLNLIVYLTPVWRREWGGALGLWEQSRSGRKPGRLVHTIEPHFNRAILFDTTQESWHGLTQTVSAPPGVSRRSLAVYYLRPAPTTAEPRCKALFAPTADQEGCPNVIELIARRASPDTAAEAWRQTG